MTPLETFKICSHSEPGGKLVMSSGCGPATGGGGALLRACLAEPGLSCFSSEMRIWLRLACCCTAELAAAESSTR